MNALSTARSSRRRQVAGWQVAWWLIVAGLVLRSAVPMLAATAAHLRGVAVADVCPVYGVRTVATAAAMDGMGMAPAAHGPHPGDHLAGSAANGQSHEHDHHQDTATTHDHCVLTPLLGAAALATGDGGPLFLVATAARHVAPQRRAAALQDATRVWYALGAHPPPRFPG